MFAALDIVIGSDEVAVDGGAVALDGGELGVEAQPAVGLLLGGDAD
jgi:hypothetical protein